MTNKVIAFTLEEKYFLAQLYGCDPQKVAVITGGVDLNLFYPSDKIKAKRELNIVDYDRVLLFAGRIQKIKGLDLLLHAMIYIPDSKSLKLLVVGGNADKANELERLKSLANELGVNSKVSFLGQVPHEMMPLFYNAADICVVPSYYESFGMVAVESLATGTPVVASRVGGLATIIKDGETGYLVEEYSPEAFALYMCLLLTNNPLRNVMASAARPSVMKYDWPLIARSVFEIYCEFIDDKNDINIHATYG